MKSNCGVILASYFNSWVASYKGSPSTRDNSHHSQQILIALKTRFAACHLFSLAEWDRNTLFNDFSTSSPSLFQLFFLLVLLRYFRAILFRKFFSPNCKIFTKFDKSKKLTTLLAVKTCIRSTSSYLMEASWCSYKPLSAIIQLWWWNA